MIESSVHLRLQRNRCVLLLVDIQERLAAAMNQDAMDGLVRNVKILLETARSLGIPVVVSEQYPKGLGATLPAFREALDQIDDLYRFEKLSFSILGAQEFQTISTQLSEQGRNQWLVTGMEAHICIYQSARDLAGVGASVHVPVDAVISRTDENYQVGLGLAEHSGSVLTSTETIVMDLLERAGTDEFKRIAKMI